MLSAVHLHCTFLQITHMLLFGIKIYKHTLRFRVNLDHCGTNIVAQLLRLAERMGGMAASVPAASEAEGVLQFARANNITQVQLAEALGVSQQTLQSYEVGRRRIPVSAMPVVARTLSVSLDELFGSEAKASRGKRGPASKLAQQIEIVSQLPKAKQQFVSQMIETVIAQAGAR